MKWGRLIAFAVFVIVVGGLVLGGCSGCWRSTVPSYVPRQGKIEQPLLNAMTKAPPNTLFSIIIAMSNQVTEADKRVLFQTIAASNAVQKMEMQRTNLIGALVDRARITQAPLRGHLHILETNGIVQNIRPMWIANMIGVEAPAQVITNIATSNEVAFLHLDLPQEVFAGAQPVPWGFGAIGMDPPVVPASIKQTVVVAVLDSGVDGTHRDLTNHLWINPKEDIIPFGKFDPADINKKDDDPNGYVDDIIGWNFGPIGPTSNGSNDVTDKKGHGTQVAGIIVGDGTGGTRTGIAPQAKIMIVREVASFATGSTTETQCKLGIEYAVTNRAHIINFSGGWQSKNFPAYAMWRNTVQNATDAGVLFVTSAGNNELSTDPPDSVTTPGRVSSALTVGAINPGSSVPNWSCNGPITWQLVNEWKDYPTGPGPGLPKPDLVAPGEGVLSTTLNNAYATVSGTSMAAPHVSGVAALLRMKDPELDPYEVRFILEETATDVESADRDAKSGWGKVNASNALAFPPINPNDYDLAIGGIHTDIAPKPNIPMLFFATVSNLGGQVVGNSEIQFYFSDSTTRGPNDLNPITNGKPDPNKFEHIGSYFVPVLGPKTSRHEKFEGVVRWTISKPRQNRWWLGVRVLPGATSGPEKDETNNRMVIELIP